MKKTLIITAVIVFLIIVIVGIVYYNKKKKREALFYASGKPRFNATGEPIGEDGNVIIDTDSDINDDVDGGQEPDLRSL
jgi:hypothetical protein